MSNTNTRTWAPRCNRNWQSCALTAVKKQQPEVVLPGHACVRSVIKRKEKVRHVTPVMSKQSRKRLKRKAEDNITRVGAIADRRENEEVKHGGVSQANKLTWVPFRAMSDSSCSMTDSPLLLLLLLPRCLGCFPLQWQSVLKPTLDSDWPLSALRDNCWGTCLFFFL